MKQNAHTWRVVAICIFLFLGTVLLFGRIVGNDFLDFDDPDYVTQNLHVQQGLRWVTIHWALVSTSAGNWHPITWLSHALDWQLYGNNAVGHHATSVLLHALNSVLAFLAIRKLTGALWPSALCAALFAWHPLRVESVAWVAERKDVLSGLFFFLTLIAYGSYVQSFQSDNKKSVLLYGLVLMSFACGLMSKPMLVTVPFLLLLLDYWPLQRIKTSSVKEFCNRLPRRSAEHCSTQNPERIGRAMFRTPFAKEPAARVSTLWLLIEKLPFFMLSLAACIVTYLAQERGGALDVEVPFFSRILNAITSIGFYLLKFIWPFNLSVIYPLPQTQSVPVAVIVLLLILSITLLSIIQRKRQPWLLIGWLWFLGMLVPVLGFVQTGLQARADRYTYLPILGIQIALLWQLKEHVMFKKRPAIVAASVVLMLVCCMARTWDQIYFWKNSEILYRHSLAVTQDNYLAESNLGTTLYNKHQYSNAEHYFRSALKARPDFATAQFKLALVLEELNKPDDAIKAYKAYLGLRPLDFLASYNIGVLSLNQNYPVQAVTYFQKAINSKNNVPDPYVGIALAKVNLNETNAAIGALRQALKLDPEFPGAAKMLARLSNH